MSTKIVAARLATSAGVTTIITRSSSPGNIDTIVQYIQFLRRSALSTGHSHSPLSSLALSPSKKSKSKSKSHSPPDNSPGILEVAALASPDSEPKQPEPEPKTFPITAPLHTRFTPSLHPIRDRHFWLLHGLAPHGTIYIDAGAHLALSEKAGLLPVGVIAVEGNFAQQEAVRIVVVERGPDPSVIGTDAQAPSPQNGNGHAVNGHAVAAALAVAAASRIPHAADPSDPFTTTTTAASKPLTRTTSSADLLTPHAPSSPHALYHGTPREVGRALVNYSAAEIARIKGLQSHDIVKALGYADSEYVALRENISLGLRR
jgi:glutamate 5-kinase